MPFFTRVRSIPYCGLIIRLRKDTVGSTPTRPTKEIKELRTCSAILFFKGSTKGQRSFFAKTSRAQHIRCELGGSVEVFEHCSDWP